MKLDEIITVEVNVDDSLLWNENMMTEEGKEMFEKLYQ
jgi:hypothetical protein